MQPLSPQSHLRLIAASFLLAVVCVGCAKHHQETICLPPLTGNYPGSPGSREQMWIDFDGFQLDPAPALAEPDAYHRIAPPEVQCLAADSATVGNLMTMEARLACCTDGRSEQAQRVAGIIQRLYLYRAAYDRNDFAAKALEAYYRLVEAEYGRDRLADALSQMDVMIQFAKEIEASQLDIPSPLAELQRKRAELVLKRAEVEQSIATLNSQLRLLTGTHPADSRRFWPMVEFSADVQEVDVHAAIARATAMRPDLAALQLVWNCFDDDTLPAVRRAVGQADPLLGSISCDEGGKLFGWLRRDQGNDLEVRTRKEQLQRLMFDTQRLAAEDVRKAAVDIAAGYEQLKLALDQLNRWRAEIQRQQELATVDQANEFDIRKAQLEWITAQSAVMKQLVAIEIGWVKLKQAQGLLVYECGYTDAKAALAKQFGNGVVTLHELPPPPDLAPLTEDIELPTLPNDVEKPQPPSLPADSLPTEATSEATSDALNPGGFDEPPPPGNGAPNAPFVPKANIGEPALKAEPAAPLELPPPEFPAPSLSSEPREFSGNLFAAPQS